MSAVVIALCSIGALAACGSGSGGVPVPRTPSSSSGASPISPVQHPRDVAVMARQACSLLSPEQAVSFGLDDPPKQSDWLFGTTKCKWSQGARDGEVSRSVNASMVTYNSTLETIYAKRQTYSSFELASVDGYPATVVRTNADLPICDVDVKTADRQSFTLTYESQDLKSRPQQACDVAKRVAAAVLANLPAKR